MKSPKFETALILIIGLGLILPILIAITSGVFIAKGLRFENVFFHFILELTGAVIALLLAGRLMLQKQKIPLTSLWIVCAFMRMGILDLVHSLTAPGNNFVWFHSLAVFFGGLFFSLTWIHSSKNSQNDKSLFRTILSITFLAISGIALLSWLYSKVVPLMAVNGNFTLFANLLNIGGGILFLVAAFYFINEYSRINDWRILILAILCSLFGAAGILFSFSVLWNINWWSWHVLRAAAYLFALLYAVRYSAPANLLDGERK